MDIATSEEITFDFRLRLKSPYFTDGRCLYQKVNSIKLLKEILFKFESSKFILFSYFTIDGETEPPLIIISLLNFSIEYQPASNKF